METPYIADILIVAETVAHQQNLAKILAPNGFVVRTAGNLSEAVQCLSARKPDLILAEAKLSDFDGLIAQAQSHSETGNPLTLLLLSDGSDPRHLVKGFALGALDYLSTPFEPQEVLAWLWPHLASKILNRGYRKKPGSQNWEAQYPEPESAEILPLFVPSKFKFSLRPVPTREGSIQQFFECQLVGMAIISTDKRWLHVNDKLCEILGYSRAELAERTWREATHPDDLQSHEVQFERMSGGEIEEYALETRFIHRDGSVVLCRLYVTCVRRPDRGIDYVLAVLDDITERKQAELIVRGSTERAQRQRAAAIKLATNQAIAEGLAEQGFRLITETASTTFDVARVGIWLLSEDQSYLDCEDLYESETGLHSSGQRLYAEEYPAYFQALCEETRVYAADALSDPRSEEFAEHYLVPNGITSMLDAAIFVHGKLVGVVCLEHLGERRIWQTDEEAFVGAIAAFVAETIVNGENRHAAIALKESQERYKSLFDRSMNCVFLTDFEGHLLDANRATLDLLGISLAQALQQTLADWLEAGQLNNVWHTLSHIQIEGFERQTQEYTLHRSDGRTLYLDTLASLIFHEGEPAAVQWIARDITARKLAEQALFEEKERAQITLHSIGDAVISTDAEGRVDYLNPVAVAMTGWSLEEAKGQPLAEVFKILHEKTRAELNDSFSRCYLNGETLGLSQETLLLSREGREYLINHTASPIWSRHRQILGAVLVFRDVTNTQQLMRQLAYEASHDALTSLVNRAEFERRLEQALTRSVRSHAQHALCFMDLDHFKLVNDTSGHAAGDELLRQIKGLLDHLLAETDTLARIGGDEFGLLLEDCNLVSAQTTAKAIAEAIRDFRFIWAGRSHQIGVSIGLTSINAQVKSIAQLMMEADIACYTAKELGRNRVHTYEGGDKECGQRQGQLRGASDLKNAMERDRLRLYYQPIVSLKTPGSPVVRHEVLLRILAGDGSDPHKLMLPGFFIPAAERYGMMAAIDRWVIRRAFKEIAQNALGVEARISINLSGNSISDESLLDFIKEQFQQQAISPQRVCFEITETCAIHNLAQAARLMESLKILGCQIALDDFGSGLSSFRYLQTLPIDYLKIDGSFVANMVGNQNDYALVEAMTQLSHIMGLQAVAEYVHSEEILQKIQTLGVDYAQGYWFGRPVSHAEIR